MHSVKAKIKRSGEIFVRILFAIGVIYAVVQQWRTVEKYRFAVENPVLNRSQGNEKIQETEAEHKKREQLRAFVSAFSL
jgi:hypothetical protein